MGEVEGYAEVQREQSHRELSPLQTKLQKRSKVLPFAIDCRKKKRRYADKFGQGGRVCLAYSTCGLPKIVYDSFLR